MGLGLGKRDESKYCCMSTVSRLQVPRRDVVGLYRAIGVSQVEKGGHKRFYKL